MSGAVGQLFDAELYIVQDRPQLGVDDLAQKEIWRQGRELEDRLFDLAARVAADGGYDRVMLPHVIEATGLEDAEHVPPPSRMSLLNTLSAACFGAGLSCSPFTVFAATSPAGAKVAVIVMAVGGMGGVCFTHGRSRG